MTKETFVYLIKNDRSDLLTEIITRLPGKKSVTSAWGVIVVVSDTNLQGQLNQRFEIEFAVVPS